MASILNSGMTLFSDQAITSNGGASSLVMQGDGNLVLYESWRGGRLPVWASNTWGNPGARAVMQPDGNLVVYTTGGRAIWASGTWGSSGATLEMQDDGNAVVYARDRRPLWASNTARTVRWTGFHPAYHGFRFPNKFVNHVATVPFHGNVTTKGRCGGMSYAALDYYFAGLPVPAQAESHFSPGRVPPDGHWLADYIYARQLESFLPSTAVKFVEWSQHSDHETWLYKGVTRWTKEEEFPKMRARIDAGTPVVLGLIDDEATNVTNIGENHQVVAFGYEYHPAGLMRVYVYDNRYAGEWHTLESEPGNPHFVQSDGDVWRGFFVHEYARRTPPVFTTPPARPDRYTLFGDVIKLSHVTTGRTLHSHPHNYVHAGTSGQQQVTAFDSADDADLWRVRGPHGSVDDHYRGRAIQHGDIIRLQHVLTGLNLHSHPNHPSPSSGQQEVTCYGPGGVGDSNDNWRVELDRPGLWASGTRLRLIHVNTGYALHSHLGHSHPVSTAGQQEVTAFPYRDHNDWWWLFELR